MQHDLLVRTVLLILVTICFTLAVQQSTDVPKNAHDKTQLTHADADATMRPRRAIKKPGFFKTLFSVIYEQWNDTKNTFGTVNKLINDNFLPEHEAVMEVTTPSGPNVSTTPYRITRSEFNKIVQRNLKGLQRLFNIELQDALKQSRRNEAEFKKNASLEVSKFL